MDLADQKCVPCRGGVAPMTADQAEAVLTRLEPEWGLNEQGHLEREFEFPDFRAAMEFANRVGDLAEAEGHHPVLHVTWGRCTVEYWTHKIDGLHDADFIMAAKTDRLSPRRSAASDQP